MFINTLGKEYAKEFSNFIIKYYPNLIEDCEFIIQDNKEVLLYLYQRCSWYQEEIGMIDISLNNYYGYLNHESTGEFGYDDADIFNNFLVINNIPIVSELKEIWRSKEERTHRSIIEVNKTLDVEYEGKKYQMTYEVLNRNSRISHLLGDRNISNSCFDIDLAGETCLKHANNDPNGGILITKVNLNERDYILSHSWIWKNKNQLCIDSVETTLFYDFLKEKNKKIMKLLLKETIDKFAKDMIETNNNKIDFYCEQENKKGIIFNYFNKDKIKELKDIKLYQKLNIVTVGTKCDHFGIRNIYNQKVDIKLDRSPNDYTGYSDVEVNNHFVIYKTNDYKNLSIDYKDKPIFRSIYGIMTCIYINNTDLKRLADLSIGTKHEYKFIKNGEYLIQTVKQFEQLYKSNIGNLVIIQNSDWARVFKIENGKLYLVESIISNRCFEKENYDTLLISSKFVTELFTLPINLSVEDASLEELIQKEKSLVLA